MFDQSIARIHSLSVGLLRMTLFVNVPLLALALSFSRVPAGPISFLALATVAISLTLLAGSTDKAIRTNVGVTVLLNGIILFVLIPAVIGVPLY